MILSCSASCPAVCSVTSPVSISFPFVLGFFATGGGTLTPFSASPTSFVREETSRFFCMVALASGAGFASVTILLLLLEKIKLAVLVGDLWGSIGDVGECKLRRDPGLACDLEAVLRRMASCRFMEREAVMAGADFFVGERTVDADTGGTTRDWDFGKAGCEITMAGGEVGGEEVMIKDLLMGF